MIELINEWSRMWAAYFAGILVQNTLFLSFLFVVLYLLKNTSARLKYSIAAFGICKLLIPPFLPLRLVESTSVHMTYLPFFNTGATAPQAAALSSSAAAPASGLSLLSFLFILWFSSLLAYLALSITGTVRLRMRLRSAIHLADPACGASDTPRQSVPIYQSDEISLPLTLGMFPRRIYVPHTWQIWSPRCRRMTLRHELAHIRRRDGFFQSLQILAQAIYFFHPLVWLLNRRVNEYREMACDDASVPDEGSFRAEYCRTLLEAAESVTQDSFACQTASALFRRKNELLNRVHYQLKEGVMRSIPKTAIVSFVILLAVLTAAFSWYRTGKAADMATRKIVDTQQAEHSSSTRFVDVTIDADDGLLLDGERLTIEQFGTEITKIGDEEKGNTIINLDCIGDMPMSKLFTVQQILQKADLTKVNYKSDLAAALPLVLPSEKVRLRIQDLPESDMLHVTVSSPGSVRIHRADIPVGNVNGTIKHLCDQNQQLVVFIDVNADVSYEDFIRVLDQVKKGGAKRIMINKID